MHSIMTSRCKRLGKIKLLGTLPNRGAQMTFVSGLAAPVSVPNTMHCQLSP